MKLDEALHEGEAQAQAALAAVEGRIGLHEGVEESGEQLRGHSDAGVADAHERRVRSGIDPHPRPRRSPRFREFRGVLQEVADHLREAVPVPVDEEGRRRRLELDPHVARIEEPLMVFERTAHELVELESLPLQVHLAPRDSRRVEQIVDEAGQLIDLPRDDRLRRARLGTARGRPAEDVQGALDGGERIPELVGEHGHELVLAVIGFEDRRLGHLEIVDVRRVTEPPEDFAVGVAYRQRAAQKPAVFAIAAPHAVLAFVRRALTPGGLPLGDAVGSIFGVNELALLLHGHGRIPGVLGQPAVGVLEVPVARGNPEDLRQGLGDASKAGFALAKGLFGLPPSPSLRRAASPAVPAESPHPAHKTPPIRPRSKV